MESACREIAVDVVTDFEFQEEVIFHFSYGCRLVMGPT